MYVLHLSKGTETESKKPWKIVYIKVSWVIGPYFLLKHRFSWVFLGFKCVSSGFPSCPSLCWSSFCIVDLSAEAAAWACQRHSCGRPSCTSCPDRWKMLLLNKQCCHIKQHWFYQKPKPIDSFCPWLGFAFILTWLRLQRTLWIITSMSANRISSCPDPKKALTNSCSSPCSWVLAQHLHESTALCTI